MQDMFGTDGVSTEGSGTTTPAAGGTMAATTAPATTPAAAAAAAAPTPTLQQALNKATDKATADAKVATDPNATHSVKLAPLAPKVLGSTGAGAAAGFLLGGPPGALIGAGLGWLTERYQIGGGPIGKAIDKVKTTVEPTLKKLTGKQ